MLNKQSIYLWITVTMVTATVIATLVELATNMTDTLYSLPAWTVMNAK